MVSFENCEDIAKVHMLESRVTTPFGKDYGFKCTCITGSAKVPKVLNHFRIFSDTEKTPGPTTFVEKSHLSVVSRID
ncbi:hypothetical protein MTR_3g047175 [Medicago truncatula]|uniref:Uncharacterized protein n=1 Tax=Medicago truncatula TaxID=3880 RepID=A0A072UUQ9_MEDTR|nr:hypothetical protein MTR_3g047175 [Medicago truncatula]